ncbi:MAG: H-NS histone family protein [Quisquiliibacterium sp.]
MSTLQELLAQREALDKQIADTKKAARSDAVRRVKELVEAYGIKADDVFGGARKTRSTGKVPPKYRDPASGKTWTGRGVEPAWIKGKDRTRFLIA